MVLNFDTILLIDVHCIIDVYNVHCIYVTNHKIRILYNSLY